MENFVDDLTTTLGKYYTQIIDLLPKLAVAIVVFLIFLFIAGRVRNLVNTQVGRRSDDPLLTKFLARVAKITMTIIGLLVCLQIIGLGNIAGSMLAGAGVSAFVIGFAFKDIGENFLAGIMMAFNRPFRVGDTVELNDIKGKVVTLNLRNTQIKTFDGKDVYIPNANVIKSPVTNYTIDGYMRYDFELGLDYGDNVDRAQEIVLNELNGIDGILQEDGKKPSVFLTSLNESTMNLTAFFWTDTFDKNVNVGLVKTRAMENSVNALNKAGYYMPGNVLEIKNYKDTGLKSVKEG